MSLMEITPASLAQVVKGRGGRLVFIDDDVTGVAKQLAEINPDIRLAFNEAGGFFVIYQLMREPATGAVTGEHLVTTMTELDPRIVQRVREIAHPDYDVAAELEKAEAKADAEKDTRFHNEVGWRAERLAHALRKDNFGADTGRYFFKDQSK